MFNIIDEFFFDIENKENNKNKIIKEMTKDEAIEAFLAEVEHYLGDYAKERIVKSSEEILELCSEFENILDDQDIFLYYRAFGNYLAADFKSAITDVKKAIEKNNEIFDYYVLTAKIYEKLNDETKAITNYIKALDLNPKCIEALKKLGYIYMTILNLQQGVECFEKAYVLDQEDDEIYSGLAGCNFEIGEIEKSLEYINKAIMLSPNNINYYYNRAIIHRVMGKNDDSIKDYKKVIDLEPSYTIAYFYLADLYLQIKEVEEARDILEQVIIINEKYADAYMKLSYCYILENDLEKALEMITKAIEIDENNQEYIYKRATIYIALGEDDKAVEDYMIIAKSDSKNPIIYDEIGKIFMGKEDYENAKIFFEKALSIDKSESFYGNIAICEYHLENLKEAKENFTKSIELSSQNTAEDYFFRGKCSYYLKEDDFGKSDFEMLLTFDSEERLGGLYYLSYIEYAQGNYQKAIEYIQEYFIHEEDDYMLLRMLSASSTEVEEYEMAREALFKCLDLSDKEAEILNDIALSYYNEKNYNEALRYYDLALEKDENLYIAYNNRAILKESKKQFMAAIKDYEKAMSLDDNVAYSFGIADCYHKMGKKVKSHMFYEDIVKKEFNNIEIIKEVINLYKSRKEYDKGLNLLDIAIDKEANLELKNLKKEYLLDIEKEKKLPQKNVSKKK